MFFTCEDMREEHTVYLVEELLDEPLSSWCINKTSNPAPYTAFKSIVWQCLYTLTFLNRMGWSHGDASHNNFMIKKVGNPYYFRNVNVGAASEWTYKLDGRTWKLKNLGWLAKISDFGFMQHLKDPRITWLNNTWLESHRIPTTRIAPGADIGYFLLYLGFSIYSRNTGNRELLQSMSALYNDWFKLLGVKEPDHMKFFYRVLDSNPDVDYLFLPTSRLTKTYEDIDVSSLLDSSYFKDVISH
jgi:serine/threonine protein kinase